MIWEQDKNIKRVGNINQPVKIYTPYENEEQQINIPDSV
jgi:hypothetical protein